MSKDRDDRFDAARPALIVQYGAASQRPRPLDRDVMIVGRAPGCDVGLDASDVAPIHCVLVRAIDGWRLRDCTGRGGTRLNGRSVQDAVLTDEDVVQVGSFSFTLHLPPEHRPPPDDPALGRARRSRHHLAQLALRLRGRLAEAAAAAAEQAEKKVAARQEELDRQAEELRVLQKDVDGRMAELKQTARQIAEDRLALQEERGRIEAESAEKRAEADAAVRASREEGEARRRALEEDARESSRALEIRARESACFAGYLRRLRQRLNEHEESLTARWEEWLREQQEASITHAQQSEKLAREESLLREQRAEVVRLMGEMRQMRRQPDPAVEALREENERLRRESAAAQEEAKALRGRLDEQPRETGAAEGLKRFGVELDTGRRVLDEQIRTLQGCFADLERTAGEAEGRIAQERTRIAQELQELERLRGALWPADGRSSGAETLVDAPSPLRQLPEAADAEAPRAPSLASSAPE